MTHRKIFQNTVSIRKSGLLTNNEGHATVQIPLFSLPGELIVKICTYGLSVRDAVNFSLTCRALDVIIGGVIPSSNTKQLWDLFLEKDFPEILKTKVYLEMVHNRRDLYVALGMCSFVSPLVTHRHRVYNAFEIHSAFAVQCCGSSVSGLSGES
jgi:hypothetical protein